MKKSEIKFLVVDTGKQEREWVCTLIDQLGLGTSVQAGSTAEALKAIKDQAINFVICDWNLPGGGGIGLLKLVKQSDQGNPVPFIMVTVPDDGSGEKSNEKIKEATRAGMDGYLIKPISQTTLAESVRQILDRKSATRSCFGALVVDDDAVVREVMVAYLNSVGMTPIYQAADGEDAKLMLQEHHEELAVIVSDWDMPRFNGLEFLKHVRQKPETSTLPFLIVTSQTSMERSKVMTAIHSSVDAYLFKPFRLSEFKEKVSAAVQKGVGARQYQHKMAMGYLLLKDQHLVEAMALFNEAMQGSPARAEAYRAVGECYYRMKQADQGLYFYRRSLVLNSLDHSTYLEFSMHQEALGDVGGAYQTLKEGVEQMPDSYDLNLGLSEHLFRNRSHAEATLYLNRALEIDPQGVRALEVQVEYAQK